MPVAWLSEPHAFKNAFFKAVAEADGGGRRLRTWRMSFKDYPETRRQTDLCLSRAKRQPKGRFGQWLKRTYIRGRYNWARSYFTRHPDDLALCWQGLTGARRAFMLGARDAGADSLFAELAPFPGYKTLDPFGVNAESGIPQNRSDYDHIEPEPALLAAVRDSLIARPSRRKDVTQSAVLPDDAGNFVFVPLQVPDDSQMQVFSGWTGSMQGFVQQIATAADNLPDGWYLRVKEHPSSKISLTDLINFEIDRGALITLDNETDSFEQLRASKCVLTVNSSMGLQAMLFDKPVITTGKSFYGMPGLSIDAGGPKELFDLMGQVEHAPYNPDFRERFLTWLLTEYYMRETEDGYDADQLIDRIAVARA